MRKLVMVALLLAGFIACTAKKPEATTEIVPPPPAPEAPVAPSPEEPPVQPSGN